MNIESLEKLWAKSHGRVPHLDQPALARLSALARVHVNSRLKFWGVVEELKTVRGDSVLHCFNFGNTTVKFPWSVEAANFGQFIELRITHSGTVRSKKNFRSILHSVETPFLVFRLDDSALAHERISPGYLLTEPGTAEQVREREIILLDDAPAPTDGVLFYFLVKRLSFSCTPLESVPCPCCGHGELRRFRMHLSEQVVLEPGWVVLMLEKDRWLWGVVAR